MSYSRSTIFRILPILILIVASLHAPAQSGNAGAVRGTVTAPSGAVVPNAIITLDNARSGLSRDLGDFTPVDATFTIDGWTGMSGDTSTAALSPALSLDGTQVAYIQTVSSVASLVVLKMANSGGTATAPVAPSSPRDSRTKCKYTST